MPAPLTTLVFPDQAAVAAAALELLLHSASDAIAQRGRFVLVLAGGTTPQPLYRLLAQADQPWQQWYLLYGDERCLPCGHPERNSTLVAESWLATVGFPAQNQLLPDFSRGLASAAADYQHRITPLLPADLALLGVGKDGHTASLFPGAAMMADEPAVIAVANAPDPPRERISLSYTTLNQARTVCFLATGASKRPALQAWRDGSELPCSRIHGRDKTFLLVDAAATNP